MKPPKAHDAAGNEASTAENGARGEGESTEFFRMTLSPGDYLPVARLLRPQGRRGELLAERLSDLPDLFAAGKRFWIYPPGSATGSVYTLESMWTPTGRNAGRVVLKLAGIDSISAAEEAAGQDLLLPESELPSREEDVFLVRDLLGCVLFNNATSVGEIVDVQFATSPDGRMRLEEAAPLLVVQPASPASDEAGPEPFLIPFVKAWIEQVDLAGRTLRMRLPDGLLEV